MRLALVLTSLIVCGNVAVAKDPPSPPPYALDYALAHRIFDDYYSCGEHREGELKSLGDNLGSDCVVQILEEIDGRTIAREYRGNGERNEDWYGWGRDVLSPCDGEVVRININEVVNQPGILGKPPATIVALKRDDGVHFLLAHLAAITVKVGDRVSAGQKLGVVGNNGYGRSPHVHIGAWHGETALQIRFDLRRSDLGSPMRRR